MKEYYVYVLLCVLGYAGCLGWILCTRYMCIKRCVYLGMGVGNTMAHGQTWCWRPWPLSDVTVLLAVFNAAALCPTMVALFPEHTRRHYTYLRSSLPHLLPSIQVCVCVVLCVEYMCCHYTYVCFTLLYLLSSMHVCMCYVLYCV